MLVFRVWKEVNESVGPTGWNLLASTNSWLEGSGIEAQKK